MCKALARAEANSDYSARQDRFCIYLRTIQGVLIDIALSGSISLESVAWQVGGLPRSNALGVPEGSLPSNALGLPEGSLTFTATYRPTHRPLMPPACPVDDLRSSATVARNVTIHRASRWHSRRLRCHPCSKERNDPPGKPVAFKAASMPSPVARSVTIHRASRWHSSNLTIQ